MSGRFWSTLGISGIGFVAALAIGNAAHPGSSHDTVQATVSAANDGVNGSALVLSNGINAAAPVIQSAKNTLSSSGIGSALTPAAPATTADPTAVPADGATSAAKR